MKYHPILIILLLSLLFPSQSFAQTRTTRLQVPLGKATVQIEKKDDNSSTKILVHDYLSSTKAIISQNGALVKVPTFYPYGSSINFVSVSESNKQYTGQSKVSDESSVYNYNARYYNPTIGIFIQPDSVEGPTRYTYVAGNPAMNNDPSGHCVQCTNPIMEQLATGDHPWSASPFSQNPVAAIMGKLDAWTGIPSLIAFSDRGHQKWYADSVADSKQYVSKTEAEMGFMAQMGMAAASNAKGLASLDEISEKVIASFDISDLFVYNKEDITLYKGIREISNGTAIAPDELLLPGGLYTGRGNTMEKNWPFTAYKTGGLANLGELPDPNLDNFLEHTIYASTGSSPYQSWSPHERVAKSYAGWLSPWGDDDSGRFGGAVLSKTFKPGEVIDVGRTLKRIGIERVQREFGLAPSSLVNFHRTVSRGDEFLFHGSIPFQDVNVNRGSWVPTN